MKPIHLLLVLLFPSSSPKMGVDSVVPEFQPDVPILRSKLLKKKRKETDQIGGYERVPVRCPEEKGQKNLLTFN